MPAANPPKLPPLGTLEEAEEALRQVREEYREAIDSAADIYGLYKEGEYGGEYLLVAFTAYYYTKAKLECAAARVAILKGEVFDYIADEAAGEM